LFVAFNGIINKFISIYCHTDEPIVFLELTWSYFCIFLSPVCFCIIILYYCFTYVIVSSHPVAFFGK